MLKWASHPDNISIKSPKGGIINVGLADPASLFFSKGNSTTSGYLWSKNTKSWVVSSLLGQAEYFSNVDEKIRQISITPFLHGWYRFAAVLGQVLGEEVLLFQSWQGGIMFGTSRFASNGLDLGILRRRNTASVAPIEGSILGQGKRSAFTFDHSYYIT